MEQINVREGPNALGTAAMVLGIIALVLSFIPVLGLVSWILAPLALIFGLIAVNKDGATKGGAITGIATGGVALLVCILWVVAFGAAVNHAAETANQIDSDYRNATAFDNNF